LDNAGVTFDLRTVESRIQVRDVRAIDFASLAKNSMAAYNVPMNKGPARSLISATKVCVFAAAACALITTSCYGQQAGSSAQGRRLAENWCASCHLVSPEQKSARGTAPAFAQIAKSPTFNADRLAYLLYDPHPNMAKLALSRRAIDDIAAYVISLKK